MHESTAIQICILIFNQETGYYPVEARFGDGSFFDQGESRLDWQALSLRQWMGRRILQPRQYLHTVVVGYANRAIPYSRMQMLDKPTATPARGTTSTAPVSRLATPTANLLATHLRSRLPTP